LAVEEWNMYGSSRLGVLSKEELIASRIGVWNGSTFVPGNPATYTINTLPVTDVFDEQVGYKTYELSNHLGNVLATITDRKVPDIDMPNSIYNYYNPQITTITDYYPFGMQIEERSWVASGSKYRFGFNGMEKDNTIKGTGNSLDFGARIYDSRLGRWLSLDPLAAMYPDLSPYHYAGNSPILFVDKEGEILVIYGEEAEFNKFKAALETEYAGLITVQRDANNVVTFVATKKARELATGSSRSVNDVIAEQTTIESYKSISKVMNHEEMTKIQLLEGDVQLMAHGVLSRQELSMETFNKLGKASSKLLIGGIVHEIEEGFQYQVMQGAPVFKDSEEKFKKAYLPAHKKALIEQAKAMGVDKVENDLDIFEKNSGTLIITTYKTVEEGKKKYQIKTDYIFDVVNGAIDLTPKEGKPDGYEKYVDKTEIK